MSITWRVDAAHSEIQLKVKHLMITTVTGYFRTFDIEVVTETDDFNSTTSIKFSADTSSIDTNTAQSDTQLKSDEVVNIEKSTQVLFTSTRYDVLNDKATLQGNLTIRGITKPISLDVEFAGMVVDPYGQIKAGFAVTGRVSRKEFELNWNAVTEAGSVVISDEVKIVADIQLVRQK